MPLHLLGKKSWNVYNTANVERVKRDEAEAQAREEAEEQRLQLEDAAHRTSLLRGEKPVIAPDTQQDEDQCKSLVERDVDTQRQRKRRRLRGEDDTDRDIRWAQEDAEMASRARARLSKSKDETTLVDEDGHIQLVPVPDARKASKIERNADAENEKARQAKQVEDQYTMRFSNAAGFNNDLKAPWYADKTKASATSILNDIPNKDIWGREDPRRREREQTRVSSNDPLAFMQKAQRQLKQHTKDKEEWQAERAAELRDLEHDEARRRKRRKHDELESFSLDDVVEPRSRHHHRHHRRRSSSRHRR